MIFTNQTQKCTRRPAIADYTLCSVWNTHRSYWRSVPLGQNFTEMWSFPAKLLITLVCHMKFLDN